MSTAANTPRLHTPMPSARPPPPMRTTRSTTRKNQKPPSSSLTPPPPASQPDTEPGTATRSASHAQSEPHHDSNPDVDVVYDSTGEEVAPAAAVHLAAPLDPTHAVLPDRSFGPLAADPVTPPSRNVALPAPPQNLTHPLPKRPDAATHTLTHPPPKKRKSPPAPASDSDNDEDGALLSEYMCPICFSPPKAAVITPCGHILCGACLHGATTARAPGAPPLCPICRTPIPGLRFVISERPGIHRPNDQAPVGPMGDLLAHLPDRARPPQRRYIPPPSRVMPGGLVLPTHGEDMMDPEEIVDVDAESDEEREREREREREKEREREWKEDPGRSGVIGLEVLTMESL